MVFLNGLPSTPGAGTAALERAVPLTAGIDRLASPASPTPSRPPCGATRKPSRTKRRNNNPHSCPAIRGFVQSGFNEVALAHAEDLVRDLTEASRFPS
jgi:hypothetical protein